MRLPAKNVWHGCPAHVQARDVQRWIVSVRLAEHTKCKLNLVLDLILGASREIAKHSHIDHPATPRRLCRIDGAALANRSQLSLVLTDIGATA